MWAEIKNLWNHASQSGGAYNYTCGEERASVVVRAVGVRRLVLGGCRRAGLAGGGATAAADGDDGVRTLARRLQQL